MTIAEAIEILRQYNKWRRDDTGELEMLDTGIVGLAIDIVCDYAESKGKGEL